jgi:hypothetical protein
MPKLIEEPYKKKMKTSLVVDSFGSGSENVSSPSMLSIRPSSHCELCDKDFVTEAVYLDHIYNKE